MLPERCTDLVIQKQLLLRHLLPRKNFQMCIRDRMLGYTNLDSEKGFAFFQKFLKEGGILEELEKAGIQEGDTVRMYGFDFDYYK